MERAGQTPRIPQTLSLNIESTYGSAPIPSGATPDEAVRIAVQNYATYRGGRMRQLDIDGIIAAMRGSDGVIGAEDLKQLETLFGQVVRDGTLTEQRARAMFNQVVGEANRQVEAGAVTATGNASSLAPLLDGVDRFGTSHRLDRITQRARDFQSASSVDQVTQSAISDGTVEHAELESIFVAATQDAGRLSVQDIRAIYRQAQIANEQGAIDDDALAAINAQIDRELVARYGGASGEGLDEVARALVDYAVLKLAPDAPDVSTPQGAEALIEALVGDRQDARLTRGEIGALFEDMARDGNIDKTEIDNVAQALATQREAGVVSDRGYDRAVRGLDRRVGILANGNSDQGHFSVFNRDGAGDTVEDYLKKVLADNAVDDSEWKRLMRMAARDGTVSEVDLQLITDAIDVDPKMTDAAKDQVMRVLGDIADIHREDPSYFWNGVSFTLSPEARAFLEDIGASDGQVSSDSVWVETRSRPQQRMARIAGDAGKGET